MARAKKPETAYTVKTSVFGLNLRAEPNLSADVLRILQNGERVKIIAEAEAPDGWVAVDGGGYVMRQYLV